VKKRERDFTEWLRESGIERARRIVRESDTWMLVSKFEAGFSSELVGRLAQLPVLFDGREHRERYLAVARAEPGMARAGAWHRAALEILHDQAPAEEFGPREIAEVAAGIDSVAALLDSVLFMCASAGSPEEATPAERVAYQDALARMDAERGIFTRAYGSFEGKAVVNHCPGARFARELFELAWGLCAAPTPRAPRETTQTPPPPAAGG
jgi:hypothetical protein